MFFPMKNRIKKILIRKKYLTFLLILILFCGCAEAYDNIMVIQSFDVKPYEDVLEGFEETCKCKVKKIVISDSDESTILRKIDTSKPDALLAIGIDALSSIRVINDIPIIYLMVLNPHSILSGEKNITGISMNIPPKKQLEIFKKAMPGIKRIGLLFDPNNSGFFVKRAQDEARKMDVELITKKVDSSKRVPSLLIDMRENVDAIWMLPDITVFSPETIEFLFLFSMENKIPVFTFSKRFIEMGALISLSFDPFDLGKQGGELAREMLSGNGIRNLSGTGVRKVIISINSTIAKKLGITISNEILNDAELIN